MLIHELTTSKKINEGIGEFFGLNNPVVAQVWDQLGAELIQNLAARFTKDPKYANMPLEQRIKAMAADNNIQQIGKKKYGEWNQYIAGLQAKTPIPLTDEQYKAAFLNWANQSLFNNKFGGLDQTAKNRAEGLFNTFLSYRNVPEPKKSNRQTEFLQILLADETARMVQAVTDLQKAQAAMNQQQQQSTATKSAAGSTTYNVPPATVPYINNNLPQATTNVKSGVAPKLNPGQVRQIAANAAKATA